MFGLSLTKKLKAATEVIRQTNKTLNFYKEETRVCMRELEEKKAKIELLEVEIKRLKARKSKTSSSVDVKTEKKEV